MEINFDYADKILSESMVISDHPQEPMVIRVMGHFISENVPDKIFNPDYYKSVTKRVLEVNPVLLKYYKLTPDDTEVCYDKDLELEKAVERIWQFQELPLDEFLQKNVPANEAPIFRLRMKKEEGLTLLSHHAFTDARSGNDLLGSIMRTMLFGEAEGFQIPTLQGKIRELKKPRPPEKKRDLWKRKWKIFLEGARLRYLAVKYPPVLLGPKTNLFGNTHHFVHKDFSNDILFGALEKAKKQLSQIEANDILMASLHLAVEEDLQKQKKENCIHAGDNRISLMTPVDIRRMRRDVNWISNLSALVSVYTLEQDRKDIKGMLVKLNQRMKEVKQNRLELASVNTLGMLKKLGVFKMCRKITMETNLPRRAVKGGDSFWKWMDTAVLTYMGRYKVPADVAPYMDQFYGYPPTVPPMALAINVGSSPEKTHICAHGSDTALSKERTEWFVDRMIYWIEQIGNQFNEK